MGKLLLAGFLGWETFSLGIETIPEITKQTAAEADFISIGDLLNADISAHHLFLLPISPN